MANPNIWAPGVAISAESTVITQLFVATGAQTLYTLTNFSYYLNAGSLAVYVGGTIQVKDVDWFETSTGSFTLAEAPPAGTRVYAVGQVELRSGYTDLDATTTVTKDSSTGAAFIPAGTEIERPAVPAAGVFRFNSDTARLEYFDGTVWDLVGTITGLTGSANIPVGTTAQRDASPVEGYFRFNETLGAFEGYKNGAWGSIGGGATGGGSDDVFYENGQTVTASYTLTAGKNAHSVGPITVSGVATVTVPSGARWVIQ